jgi:hypothetical protein
MLLPMPSLWLNQRVQVLGGECTTTARRCFPEKPSVLTRHRARSENRNDKVARFRGLVPGSGGAFCASAPAPTGPVTPQPRTPIQQAPVHQNKIVTRVSLVNTPVTVRDQHGQMVHTLHAKDFQITDNGVRQQITHFDLGGDPLCVVFLVETSARIGPLMVEIQKTGIVFAETVMGLTGEAVVAFHDSVDFSGEGDVVQKSINNLKVGTNNSKLYDAMTVGVNMLSERPQRTAEAPGRRRVMVIVSEAQDVGSETKAGRCAPAGAAIECHDLHGGIVNHQG